ncbi:Ethylene-responsive transcription factor CRF1 [Hordeum vulgare]|nr:Ethylene-responsive transcription factor CRF1 [Hordeum vulgare]
MCPATRPPTALFAALSRLCSPHWRRHCTTMPPHRRGSLGFRGVRERPSGTFYAEICSDDMRLGLGTFDTTVEAARVYEAVAWRLNRPHRDMNFPKVMARQRAQRLAPPPRVITEEDRRENWRRECHLSIAEMDEHAMTAWRQQFLQDALDERAFFIQRRAEQVAYREDRCIRKQAVLFNMELKGASTWDPDDERWDDAFITKEESDTSASEEDEEEYFLLFFIIKMFGDAAAAPTRDDRGADEPNGTSKLKAPPCELDGDGGVLFAVVLDTVPQQDRC